MSGTEIVRPSRRSTIKSSSVNRTPLTRSPGRLEVFIPGLQQSCLVLDDEPLNSAQFDRRESQVTRQRHGGQPELRRVVVTVYVDVRQFVDIVADEVDTVGPDSKNCRHSSLHAPDEDPHTDEVRLRGFDASMCRIVDA